MAIVDGKIRCSDCETFKTLDAYPKSSHARGYGICRPCANDRSAKRRQDEPEVVNANFRRWYSRNQKAHAERVKRSEEKNPSGRHNSHLLRTYGISIEEYNAILERQGGGCAICEAKPEDGRNRFAVDHCHATGKVRGVLCHGCNGALGKFGDSIAGLMKAIEYLKGADDGIRTA